MQEATSLVLRTSTGLTALAILLRLHALTPPPSLCRSQSLGLERHSSLLLRNHYLVKKLRFLFCPVQNTLFFWIHYLFLHLHQVGLDLSYSGRPFPPVGWWWRIGFGVKKTSLHITALPHSGRVTYALTVLGLSPSHCPSVQIRAFTLIMSLKCLFVL